jgi:hypothetical protein
MDYDWSTRLIVNVPCTIPTVKGPSTKRRDKKVKYWGDYFADHGNYVGERYKLH